MKKVFLLAAIFVLSLSSSVISQTHTPETDLAAFIKFSRSMRQDFNSRGVESRKQWFSAPLYKLFLNELKRQDEYLKKNPTDMPYFGDGVPFQSTKPARLESVRIVTATPSVKALFPVIPQLFR